MKKKKGFVIIAGILVFVTAICVIGLYLENKAEKSVEEVYQISSETNDNNSEAYNEPQSDEMSEQQKASLIDFDEIRKNYKDVVGYIKIPNTKVDYPIVQGEDNSFYLDHLANGEKNKYGAIFLDYRLKSDFTSDVSAIYGHDATNGSMFGSLELYEKQEFYNQNPSYEIYTENGDYTVDLIAAYLLKGETGSFPSGFVDKEDMDTYIEEIKEKSFFKSEITSELGERLVILSTCSTAFEDARLAVVGKIRRE